jgi:hypothetical protein
MRTPRENEMKDINNGGKDAYRNYQWDERKWDKKIRENNNSWDTDVNKAMRKRETETDSFGCWPLSEVFHGLSIKRDSRRCTKDRRKNISSIFVRHNSIVLEMNLLYRVIQKEIYTFKNLLCKYYWTYGDMLYIDWRENSQSYFHTLQTLYMSPTCDAADVKSIIQLFPHTRRNMSQVTAATALVTLRFRSSISELWEISFPSVHRTWA